VAAKRPNRLVQTSSMILVSSTRLFYLKMPKKIRPMIKLDKPKSERTRGTSTKIKVDSELIMVPSMTKTLTKVLRS